MMAQWPPHSILCAWMDALSLSRPPLPPPTRYDTTGFFFFFFYMPQTKYEKPHVILLARPFVF